MITSSQKLLMARAGAGGSIVGLVGYAETKVTSATNSIDIDVSGLNIQSGDVGIFICGMHSGATNQPSGWTADNQGSRAESAHITFSGGETTVNFTGSNMDDGVGTVFVYRGYTFTSYAVQLNFSGMPNPPSASVSSGDKFFIFGGIDDDILTMTAPSGYSLILADSVGVQETGMSYASAEKDITASGTEDPAAFGGAGSDINLGYTYVLTPA